MVSKKDMRIGMMQEGQERIEGSGAEAANHAGSNHDGSNMDGGNPDGSSVVGLKIDREDDVQAGEEAGKPEASGMDEKLSAGRLQNGTYAAAITKEDAVRMIREAAERLGHVPNSAELEVLTPIRRWHIRRIFGSFSWALHECGLGQVYNGQRIPVELLFREWIAVARRLQRLPSIAEFNETSTYTTGPYQRRFLSWRRVPHALEAFAKKHGLDAEWQDVMKMIERGHGEGGLATTGEWLKDGMKPPVVRSDRPVYGPAMVPAAQVHEPINEMGVVYLFGTVAERLGYMVTLVQVEFPDCEALQEVGPGRWQRIRIEFEYESRNFLRHRHEAEQCDMIVCWKHNWPECPLEVLELREVVRRQ